MWSLYVRLIDKLVLVSYVRGLCSCGEEDDVELASPDLRNYCTEENRTFVNPVTPPSLSLCMIKRTDKFNH
jgi:hypothetical protein